MTAVGFWGALQRAFFDVRVFDPFAPSYAKKSITTLFKDNEREKKKKYGRRIMEIEKSTFTPLIFSVTGGCGKECNTVLKKLATMISGNTQSAVMSSIRTEISFSLLRSLPGPIHHRFLRLWSPHFLLPKAWPSLVEAALGAGFCPDYVYFPLHPAFLLSSSLSPFLLSSPFFFPSSCPSLFSSLPVSRNVGKGPAVQPRDQADQWVVEENGGGSFCWSQQKVIEV